MLNQMKYCLSIPVNLCKYQYEYIYNVQKILLKKLLLLNIIIIKKKRLNKQILYNNIIILI